MNFKLKFSHIFLNFIFFHLLIINSQNFYFNIIKKIKTITKKIKNEKSIKIINGIRQPYLISS